MRRGLRCWWRSCPARTDTLTQAGLPELVALNGGIQAAFGVAAVISIAALVLRVLHSQHQAARRRAIDGV